MSRLLGRKTIRFDTVASTNEILKGLTIDGIEAGTVVTSNIQTHGRGRLDRKWESPEGGLWMSVLLETDTTFESSKFGLLPLMAGASVATAIIMEYDLDAGVKWPNDVLIGGRKVSGILCELIERGGMRCAVVGIGVNVNNPVKEGYEFSGLSTSVVEEFGKPVGLEDLENAVLEELDFRNRLLSQGEYDKILDDWRELTVTLGKRVAVNTPGGLVNGTANDVDDNGSLILDCDGRTEKISVGDCQHLE